MSGSLGLPAYGGYAATPQQQALLMARRMFPYQVLVNPGGLAGAAATAATAPAAGQDQSSSLPGYDNGGAVDFSSLSQQSSQQQAIDAGLISPGGVGPGVGIQGPGGNANYGPTSQGFAGLAPASMTTGQQLAASAASLGLSAMGVPGSGLVSGIASGFNGGVNAAQAAQMMNAGLGISAPTMGQNIGNGIAGALGQGIAGPMGIGTYGGMPASAAAQSIASMQAMAVNPDDPLGALAGFGVNQSPTAAQIADIASAYGPSAVPGVGTQAMGMMASPQSASMVDPSTGLTADPTNLGDPNAEISVDGHSSYDNGNTMGMSADDGTNSDNNSGNVAGLANGGAVKGVIKPFSAHHFLTMLSRGSGLVHGGSMGRADKLKASVPRGGYVIPADVVSGLGQGNTIAGAKKMTSMLGNLGGGKGSLPANFANGGAVGGNEDIRISAGEYYVHPHHVMKLGDGNLQRGHTKLDGVVRGVRTAAVHHAVTAPPPR